MKQTGRKRLEQVVGPDGSILTLRDLPPRETKRWVSRQKAKVVVAVDSGLLSLDEACRLYAMSVEEFLSWQRAWAREGQRGLRATRSTSGRPSHRERLRDK